MTDSSDVSWQRQNHMDKLPQRSIDLVQNYARLLQQQRIIKNEKQTKDSTHHTRHDNTMEIPCPPEILKRVQRVVTAAAASAHADSDDNTNNNANKDGNNAEYRCLETGGFVLPTVSLHPWYQDSKLREEKLVLQRQGKDSDNHTNNDFAVLDLGCGLGADGRRMLIDGFATHLVGMDSSAAYLTWGCELFGDHHNRGEDYCKASTTTAANSTASTSSIAAKDNHNTRTIYSAFHPKVTFLVVDAIQECDMVAQLARQALWAQQQWTNDNAEQRGSPSRHHELPYFDAVYAGKFLHCLQTRDKLYRLLCQLRQLLLPGRGVLFGVYGRNFEPACECSSEKDFRQVLVEAGFVVSLIVEEAAGATWFCAHHNG